MIIEIYVDEMLRLFIRGVLNVSLLNKIQKLNLVHSICVQQMKLHGRHNR